LRRYSALNKKSRKTVEVDVDMIDRSTDELAKLIFRLDTDPKKN